MSLQAKLTPRKQPLQQRAEKRVAEIIAAYRRLLNGDTRRITTNSIAQEAGIPVSSLYQYFPNKEAIAYAVYGQWAEEAIAELKERCESARHATHGFDFLLKNPTHFFSDFGSARIVHQLGPIMDSSPELKKVQRNYLKQMADIVAELLRQLGSDWPDAPLTNIVSLLIELNTTTFRHMGRQTSAASQESYGHWQAAAQALLQRCIEIPYAQIEAQKNKR